MKVIASSIHGYGVVTTRAFLKGELICYGDGVLYREEEEFDDTYALVLPNDDSVPNLGEQFFWDLVDQTRWFNHACDPNTEVRSQWDHEAKIVRAWWVALRDVAPDEEITYDYGFVAEVAEPCACGAVNCRGVIVDPDPAELAKLPEHLKQLLRPPARAAS